MRIPWVPVRSSSYKDTPIEAYHFAYDPAKPLSGPIKAELDAALLAIYGEVKRPLESAAAPDGSS